MKEDNLLWCWKCQSHKTKSDFCKNSNRRSGKDGYNRKCRQCTSEYHKVFADRLKRECFDHYGGCLCQCCGETELAFLGIDHINGEGAKHRREISKNKTRTGTIYGWLRKNSFPGGFRVLCHNCNLGSYMNGGICPHQKR
jgi:hypothetical protein